MLVVSTNNDRSLTLRNRHMLRHRNMCTMRNRNMRNIHHIRNIRRVCQIYNARQTPSILRLVTRNKRQKVWI